jgi:peptidoglycan/LPS O-acetylase OafA/YrhL
MSGYQPIAGGAGVGAATKAVSRRDAGRIELTAVSGMRFFATGCLVCGRAIENLWIDEGTEGKLFSQTICSGLHTLAKDVVSFYYILSGFTMCWGYLSRDFDTDEVRWRYWTRRFARFYPDFFLSTVVTFLLKLPYFFGCHDYGWPSWVSNASSLLLFTAWYRFIPGTGYINGPVWFIVTLFWLWVFFPYLLKPVKMVFANCGWSDFMAKLALVWIISLLPWSIIDQENLEALRWGLRCFPILRIPEFVIGMAIALRVNKDKEEMDDQENSSEGPPPFRPQMLAGVGPPICNYFSDLKVLYIVALYRKYTRALTFESFVAGMALAGSYYLWKVMSWPDDCMCLPGDRFLLPPPFF